MKSFAKEAFTSGNVAVVGTGIDSARLADLVDKALADAALPTSSPIATAPSRYFGGSTRVDSHEGPQTVFIGFGSTTPSPVLSVLSTHVAPTQSLKWPSAPRSPATVTSVYLPYSDAVLTGVLVQAADAKTVTEAAKSVVEKLKKPLSGDELKIAVARAKFSAAAAIEGREGLVEAIGGKVSCPEVFPHSLFEWMTDYPCCLDLFERECLDREHIVCAGQGRRSRCL